jgi:hypothetical protein
MAYSKEQKTKIFKSIISEIENGASLRTALKNNNNFSSHTFNDWVNEDEEKGKQYARAKEQRTDLIFEEILNIADSQEGDVIHKDGIDIVNHDVINRARLRIDARKWMLGKMDKNKYGDKIQTEHSGEITTNVISLGNGVKPNETNT